MAATSSILLSCFPYVRSTLRTNVYVELRIAETARIITNFSEFAIFNCQNFPSFRVHNVSDIYCA